MTIETDFRALLAGHAGTAALVGTRIALNGVPQGSALPLIVFTASHQVEYGLDGTQHSDSCVINVQCWGETAASAAAVAAQVSAAVLTAPAAANAAVVSAEGAFDEELGLDAVSLAVEWIVT